MMGNINIISRYFSIITLNNWPFPTTPEEEGGSRYRYTNIFFSFIRYLYDLLTKGSVVRKKIPMLILCNKTDKVTAHTKEFIRKQMEKEMYVFKSQIFYLYSLYQSATVLWFHFIVLLIIDNSCALSVMDGTCAHSCVNAVIVDWFILKEVSFYFLLNTVIFFSFIHLVTCLYALNQLIGLFWSWKCA